MKHWAALGWIHITRLAADDRACSLSQDLSCIAKQCPQFVQSPALRCPVFIIIFGNKQAACRAMNLKHEQVAARSPGQIHCANDTLARLEGSRNVIR